MAVKKAKFCIFAQEICVIKMIYVKTGEGGGKTTSAIGLCVRALGHNKKVYIIQFMKKRKTGELILKKFKNCVIKQFGRKEFVNLKNPDKIDKELAQKAVDYAFNVINKSPFMIILDEVNIAAHIGLINKKDIIKLINHAKEKNIHLILTGRYAPKEFIKLSDIATLHTDLKRIERNAEPGIEF